MKLIRKLAIVVVALGSVSVAQADPITITVLIGDKDCFGVGGVCSDGDLIHSGTLGGTNFRGPGDPLGTDQLGTSIPLGGPSFDFGLDLDDATPLSASLELFTAGIELIGATFFFNGTDIGFYTEPDGFENIAATVVFDVPIYLLSDLNNISLSVPDLGLVQDGFIIDYLELTVEADDCSPFPGGGVPDGCFPGPGPFPAPEPGTLALFGIGLAAMGLARRRKEPA